MSSKIESRSQIEIPAEAAEETKESAKTEVKKKDKSLLDEFLKLLSSVKFGICMLVTLAIFSAVGTFIVQQGTSDFPKFFQALTPAERAIYQGLGFLDIYHSWYFNLLLLTLSLNIVLATIDRAPGYWHFITTPKLSISESYARHQQWHTQIKLPASAYTPELVGRVTNQCERTLLPRWVVIFGPLRRLIARLSSFRLRVSESKDGSTTVFAERGVWNRLAFCGVHVALLMILIGWFVGNKWGEKGIMQFAPGEASDSFFSPGPDDNSFKTYKLPFVMKCTDIKQDLIDSSKPDLSPQNTLDWHTVVLFQDSAKKYKGDVHLNEPIDFRGYRFFQSSFDPINSARQVVLQVTPKDGQGEAKEVTLSRNGSVDVPGMGKISWKDFYPEFSMDPKTRKPFTISGDYNRPAAELLVTLADGTSKTIFGFLPAFLDSVKQQAPFLSEATTAGNFTVVLKDFEKVSRAHTLQVQYDPGVDLIYGGCTLLVLLLISVFFFSHERIWVLIKPGQSDLQLYFAGNTNRNRPSFEVRFNKLLSQFKDEKAEKKD